MTSINLHYRPSERAGNLPGSLYLQVIHRRRTRKVALSYKIYKEEWDNTNKSIITDNPNRDNYLYEARNGIEEETSRLKAIIHELESKGTYFEVEEITDVYHSSRMEESGEHSLKKLVSRLSRNLSRSGQERTARAYGSSLRSLLLFLNKNDIPISYLSPSLVKNYERHLKSQGKAPNTISFYMRNLRSIYNKAITKGLVTKPDQNLFSGVYTGVQKTHKRALSRNQIQALYDVKLAEGKDRQRLETCRRLFFFCLYARGMSFVDMAYLRKNNLRNGIIRYYRKKTGGRLEIKITPAMQEIIDYFSPMVKASPYVFPVIDNNNKKPHRLQYETGLTTQNRLLKELARLAGTGVKLSTHMARHSWAT
ncbi:phage integrase SAM-like domain-containing protein, partial [Dysgonomonas sp. 521]|uniref:phage integrase SAM-like domain-containing protein n=1 Tax=Dysgonomonas sp. 521 TaxID=2302932 RepID=UPI0013D00D8D